MPWFGNTRTGAELDWIDAHMDGHSVADVVEAAKLAKGKPFLGMQERNPGVK